MLKYKGGVGSGKEISYILLNKLWVLHKSAGFLTSTKYHVMVGAVPCFLSTSIFDFLAIVQTTYLVIHLHWFMRDWIILLSWDFRLDKCLCVRTVPSLLKEYTFITNYVSTIVFAEMAEMALIYRKKKIKLLFSVWRGWQWGGRL